MTNPSNILTETDIELLASLGGNTSHDSNEEISKEEAQELTSSGSLSTTTDSATHLSNHYSSGLTSGIEEKAANLLGSGINAEAVASALGVTPSRISQLMSNRHFSDRVARLRYENLQAHNKRDSEYDSLEDALIEKLKKAMPLMVKPRDILDAMTRINSAKRRGQSAPDTSSNTQNVVNLILPNVIAQKFVTNGQNQVTRAGDQNLLTMPSGDLRKQVEIVEVAEETSDVQEKRS